MPILSILINLDYTYFESISSEFMIFDRLLKIEYKKSDLEGRFKS